MLAPHNMALLSGQRIRSKAYYCLGSIVNPTVRIYIWTTCAGLFIHNTLCNPWKARRPYKTTGMYQSRINNNLKLWCCQCKIARNHVHVEAYMPYVLWMDVCIHIYTYTHVYMYIWTYMYIMYVWTYVSMYVCTYIYVHNVCMNICKYVCTYIHVHNVCMNICKYACMYLHICT